MSAIELRLGRWQDALADVSEVDVLISDPPYSERTHAGLIVGVFDGRGGGPRKRAELTYLPWTAADAAAFVAAWSPRCRGWFVIITDHILCPAFEAALRTTGRYVFQPLPFLELGKQPRLTGDGPASWTNWIVVARPDSVVYSRWGSLPGGYVPPPSVVGMRGSRPLKGGKPLWLMQSLVRDYSRPGDLICDPCAGAATTLIAAAIEHRRGIGAELDASTHALALKRIARGHTPDLFTHHERERHERKADAVAARAAQGSLTLDAEDAKR